MITPVSCRLPDEQGAFPTRARPIGAAPLRELAAASRSVAIVIADISALAERAGAVDHGRTSARAARERS